MYGKNKLEMQGTVLSTLKRDSQVKEKMCRCSRSTIVLKHAFNCIIMFYLYQVAWIPIESSVCCVL